MAKKSTSGITKQQAEKRVDLIADIFIGLSGLWLVLTLLGLLTSTTKLDLNLGLEAVVVGLQCLMAIGLLKRNKNAYYAARLLGLLALISAIIFVPSFLISSLVGVYMLLGVLTLSSIVGVMLLLSFLTFFAGLAFWVYLFFLLNSKPVKGIFKIR
jgi:hypothetical protein